MEDIGDKIRRKKKALHDRLIEIYDRSDEDVKAIICLLVQTEYECAIRIDNYNSCNGIQAKNRERYEEENKELIEHCWESRVGR